MAMMHRYRAHYSFGPNFAYALAARRASAEDIASWDFSEVRCMGCGAEPIHPATMREFADRFAPCGLKPGAIMPAYGMAEATLAMTFHPLGTPLRTTTVDAEGFRADGVVQPSKPKATALTFVSCGRPFAGHELRILGAEGQPLPEGSEGEIEYRGPSVTAGYWQNPEATAEAYRGGWLRTGDLGFLRDGNLYITGRSKDLVILNGRNHHPQAIEWAVQDVDGVRKGNVVAFSRPGADSEELVVVAEKKSDAAADLPERIVAAVSEALSLKVSDVVLLDAGQLPKTSSGKLQRRKTRDLYLRGTLAEEGDRTLGSSGEAMTVAKHVARSIVGRATHAAGKLFARND
jgi:fatty-acyl-CoA synthase